MPKPQPTLFSRLFLGNLRNKGTSLVFAILIWVFAFGNTREDRTITDVQIRIQSDDSDQVVLSLKHSGTEQRFTGSAELIISGPRNLVDQVAPVGGLAGVFLVSKSGQVLLQFDESYIGLPKGVTVMSSDPRSLDVQLDELRVKSVPVSANITVSPTSRFQKPAKDEFTITPATVEVAGPSNVLDDVSVFVEAPPVNDWNEPTWSGEFPLVLRTKLRGAVHPGVHLKEGRSQTVQVSVELQSALKNGTFTVPIVYGRPSAPEIGALILAGQDTEVELTCSGTPDALADLQENIGAGFFEIWVQMSDFSGKFQTVESTDFEWPAGSLPFGIERDSLTFKPSPIQYKVERPRESDGEQE